MGLVSTNSDTRTGKKKKNVAEVQTIAPRGLIKGRRAEERKSSKSAGTKQTHTK